jgi:hypothetical protein
LDALFGGLDPSFKVFQFFLQEVEPMGGSRCIDLGVECGFLLVDRLTHFGDNGPQERLGTPGLDPAASLCYFRLKGRKIPCWQKFNLEADRELGANLVEDLLDCTRILDQSRDRAR